MTRDMEDEMRLPVWPARLPKKGEVLTGEADAALLAQCAEAFGILAVESLRWKLTAKPWRRSGFQLSGVVEAEVVQACIITLEPVREVISEEVELRFLPEGGIAKRPAPAAETDVTFDAMPEDEPEFYAGEPVDVWPYVTEHVALGLDPYPRSAGAQFDDAATVAPDEPSALAKALLKWGKPGGEPGR